MPRTILEITEGWTARLGPFTLKSDGVPQSLTGLTVTLQLRGSGQSGYVDTAGDTTPDPDQVTNPGQISWDPDASDMVYTQSPYTIRWKVVDGSGKVAFWPNGEHDQVKVHRP